MCAGTLSGHDETGHAVGDTGTGCQEGDAHDDVWDAQREADDGDLRHRSNSQQNLRLSLARLDGRVTEPEAWGLVGPICSPSRP